MQSGFQPREFPGLPRCRHQPVPVWRDCRLWEGLGQDTQVSAHKLVARTAVNNKQTNSSALPGFYKWEDLTSLGNPRL